MAAADRYQDNLNNPVASGNGCHGYLMSTSNLGVIAGIDPQQIHADIRRVLPQGKRPIPDKEINDAIKKALSDFGNGTFMPQPKPEPIVKHSDSTLRKIISSAVITTEIDLWESSPVRLMDEPEKDAVLLYENLFDGNDFVWSADRHEPGTPSTIRPVCEWTMLIREGKISLPPFFIINSLSGMPARPGVLISHDQGNRPRTVPTAICLTIVVLELPPIPSNTYPRLSSIRLSMNHR